MGGALFAVVSVLVPALTLLVFFDLCAGFLRFSPLFCESFEEVPSQQQGRGKKGGQTKTKQQSKNASQLAGLAPRAARRRRNLRSKKTPNPARRKRTRVGNRTGTQKESDNEFDSVFIQRRRGPQHEKTKLALRFWLASTDGIVGIRSWKTTIR